MYGLDGLMDKTDEDGMLFIKTGNNRFAVALICDRVRMGWSHFITIACSLL